jgi:hypothetical protein
MTESTRDRIVRFINSKDATITDRINHCLDYLVEEDDQGNLKQVDDNEFLFHLGISLLEAAVESIPDTKELYKKVSNKLNPFFDKKGRGFELDQSHVKIAMPIREPSTYGGTKTVSVDISFLTQSSWILNLLTKEQKYSYLAREALNKENIFYIEHGAAEKPETKIKCLEQITDEPNTLVWLTLLYFKNSDWDNTLKYAQKCLANPILTGNNGIKSYLLPPLVKSVYELRVKPRVGYVKDVFEIFDETIEAYTMLEGLCKEDGVIERFYSAVLTEIKLKNLKSSNSNEHSALEKILRGRRSEALRKIARVCVQIKGDYAQWYNYIFEDFPEDAEANLMLARLDAKANKLADAETKYKKVLVQKECPAEFKVEANLFLARSGSEANTLIAKEKYYKAVLGLQSDNTEARLFLGGINLRESINPECIDAIKLRKAIEYYASVLKKDAHNSSALRGLGRCCFYEKKWEPAFVLFEKSLECIKNDLKEPTEEGHPFYYQGDLAAMLFSQYKRLSRSGSSLSFNSKVKEMIESPAPVSQNSKVLLLEIITKLCHAHANKVSLASSRKRKNYFGFDPLAVVSSDNPMDVSALVQEEIRIISKHGYDYNPAANKPPFLARMYLALGGKRGESK